MLARRVDGVLLVVEQPYARRETVRAACRQLADANARLIGTVMNRAERDGNYYDRPTPTGEGQSLS